MSPEGLDEELPYEGLRVVDLSQAVAGPHCGMLFALYGADVVKVEPPEGDRGRATGKRHGDFSAYGIAFNRGKRSVALDLRRAEGAGFTTAMLVALVAPRLGFALICAALILHLRPDVSGRRP